MMDYGVLALFTGCVATVLAIISLLKHRWSAATSGVHINDIALANRVVRTVSDPVPVTVAKPAKVTKPKKPRARKTTAHRR